MELLGSNADITQVEERVEIASQQKADWVCQDDEEKNASNHGRSRWQQARRREKNSLAGADRRLCKTIIFRRLGVWYCVQVIIERFAEVDGIVITYPTLLDLSVNAEHEWRSCTGRNLARAMSGAMKGIGDAR